METRKEKTRRRIVESAAELFGQQSYHAVNINQICDRAEINKATLYQHYASKEALAVATVEYHFERQKAEVYEAAMAAAPNPVERLSGIYQRIYQQHLGRSDRGDSFIGCPFVNISSEMAADSPAIREAVNAVIEGLEPYYRLIARDAKVIGYASRDRDADQVTAALITIMQGAMVQAKTQNRPDVILESLETAKLILRG